MTVAPLEDEDLVSALKLSMRAVKGQFGLSQGANVPVIRSVGVLMGNSVHNIFRSEDALQLLREISEFWTHHGLGEMEVEARPPFVIRIRECYDCLGYRYGVGEPLCAFKEGLFKSIIDHRLGSNVEIKEVGCCGTGLAECRFRVTKLKQST